VALSILIKMFLDHLLRELLFGGTPGHYGRVQQIKFLRIKIRMSSKNSAPFIRLAQITHNCTTDQFADANFLLVGFCSSALKEFWR